MEHDNKNAGIGIGTVIFLGMIWWWWNNNTTWQGFYYPNAENLTRSINSPTFKTVDECRDWVDEMVYKYNPSGYGYDYECGKNCKKKSDIDMYLCEETVD